MKPTIVGLQVKIEDMAKHQAAQTEIYNKTIDDLVDSVINVISAPLSLEETKRQLATAIGMAGAGVAVAKVMGLLND